MLRAPSPVISLLLSRFCISSRRTQNSEPSIEKKWPTFLPSVHWSLLLLLVRCRHRDHAAHRWPHTHTQAAGWGDSERPRTEGKGNKHKASVDIRNRGSATQNLFAYAEVLWVDGGREGCVEGSERPNGESKHYVKQEEEEEGKRAPKKTGTMGRDAHKRNREEGK